MPFTDLTIHYLKSKPIPIQDMAEQYVASEEDTQYEYNPFAFSQFQQYNPLYSLFFVLNETNYNQITLNHRYSILNADTLFDNHNKQIETSNIHFKFSPLLDPIHYLVGKYNLSDPALKTLPKLNNSSECFPKLTLTNNVSYVDTFFCYLSNQLLETHHVQHGVRFYGSYLGIQKVFKYNASDDFDYISGSDFFNKHLGKDFQCDIQDHSSFANFGSRGNKERLNIEGDDASLSSMISVLSGETRDVSPTTTPKDNTNTEISEYQLAVDAVTTNNTVPLEDASQDNTQDINDDDTNSECDSNISYTTIDDDEDEDDDDDDEKDEDDDADGENDEEEDEDDDDDEKEEEEDEEEPVVNIYIRDFPVQMICQEKCEGTMDQLLEKGEVNETVAAAYLMQIIMTLIIYQGAFQFTHNDLHTNNIMYVSTPRKYLYYCFSGKYYRVPTYGKIFKLIDFGRAWYSFRGQTLFSDCFMGSGDASTQYNCEPIYNPNRPRVEPNYSFDLCRLGCSIFDMIMGEEEMEYPAKMNHFQKTIARWCCDDEGKNVLCKRNGKERYPGFKLYKMIARTVHNHTPENQLKYKYFSQFEFSPKKLAAKEVAVMKKEIVNIDTILSCV